MNLTEIDYKPRMHIVVFIILCTLVFVLAVSIAICSRIMYDSRRIKEEDKIADIKKREVKKQISFYLSINLTRYGKLKRMGIKMLQ